MLLFLYLFLWNYVFTSDCLLLHVKTLRPIRNVIVLFVVW